MTPHTVTYASPKDAMPAITLQLSQEGMDKFTALLQSGVEIETTAGEPLLQFLEKIPGFTPEYIDNDIQTIFLDGTAIDDVHAPLTDTETVIALSAAMPGLSGAIYRKNSIHSPLRSVHHHYDATKVEEKTISIYLKLFNSIARDRGAEMLRQGVTLKTSTMVTFLQTRPWLADHIQAIMINDDPAANTDALMHTLQGTERVHLALTN